MQLQPAAQPGEQLIGDGAALSGQLLRPDLLRLRPMRVTTSPGVAWGTSVTSTSSWSMHIRPTMGQRCPAAAPPAPVGQAPGQAVGIADGDHGQPPVLRRAEGQAVARPLPRRQGAHRGHPGPQREHRAQVEAAGWGCRRCPLRRGRCPPGPRRTAGAAGSRRRSWPGCGSLRENPCRRIQQGSHKTGPAGPE